MTTSTDLEASALWDQIQNLLSNDCRVRLDSSAKLINRLQAKIQQAPNPGSMKLPSSIYLPSPINGEEGAWIMRTIDLLRKIGEMTTPVAVNMYELSQSWATRRYFWAVDTVSDFLSSFRLNDNVRGIDPHQKTVLSDDFGIGMAGLIMEQLFGSPWFVDVSIALNDPDKFKAIQKTGDASPDYLFYDNGGRMFVVECKGSQSSPSYVREQIVRGLQQLPSINFESDPRSVTYIVIATHLGKKTTTVYVVDPPYEEHSTSDRGRHSDEEAMFRRIGEDRWIVQDPAGFDRRNYAVQDAMLLSWGGQYESARMGLIEHVGFPGDRRVEPLIDDERAERSVRSQKKDTVVETYIEDTYIGTLRPLFPEIGALGAITVFQGIHASLMNELDAHGQTSGEVRSMLKERLATARPDPNVSVGANGTCFIIEGLK